MPSTYSSSLRLELQATGENANTWGVKTNNNLNLLQQAIAGYEAIDISGGSSYVVSAADGVSDQARNAVLDLTGTLSSAISVVVPDVEKTYWVRCRASGADVTFRTSAGTGVVLPRDLWVFLVATGTSVINALPPFAQLSAANTFTGINTFTSVLNINGTLSVTDASAVRVVLGITSATDSVAGILRLADTSSALVGTDAQRAVTPEAAKAVTSRVQQNVQASVYSFVSADAGKHVFHPASATSTATYTIPSNASVAFAVGTVITVINHASAGPIDLSITSDTLYNSQDGAVGARQVAAAGLATIVKIANTEWVISGIGVS
ncbi:MAG: hypothetical protein EBT97_09205 [Actinobacteria bacterium]|nr:hypothetical protein [Actinomycetota bacterium]